MKKVIALILTVSMLFTLAACGGRPAQSSAPVSSKPVRPNFFPPRGPAAFSLKKVEVLEQDTLWLRYTAVK